ncbi:MAG: hypothetical protein Q8Q02_16835, partial [Nocardioides sp.]|nr:hypothetical protein [Nocardioides sp.]
MLSLNVMVGRLILAVLAVGAVVLFAMYLQEGGALSFVATVSAFAVSTYLNRAALGVRLDEVAESGSRFDGLLTVLSEHPLYRLVVGSRAYWLALGVGIGIAVALVESALLARWFGDGPHTVTQQAFTLSLILLVIYCGWGLAEERHAYAASEWRLRLRRELYGLVGADPDDQHPAVRVVLRAAGRAALVTVMRKLALLILPAIVESDLLIGAVATAVVAVIVGGETLWALAQRVFTAASFAAPEPNGDRDSERRAVAHPYPPVAAREPSPAP